jgi:hypothetical protein
MQLIHYSTEPVTFDPDYQHPDIALHHNNQIGKPVGLWVSVPGDNDWASWCESIGWVDRIQYAYDVTLHDDARILEIPTGDELDMFHDRYAQPGHPLDTGLGNRLVPIEWERVANDYDGIIIAPYQRSHRHFGPLWYFTWDCASGCIWNYDVIDSVTEIAEVTA